MNWDSIILRLHTLMAAYCLGGLSTLGYVSLFWAAMSLWGIWG